MAKFKVGDRVLYEPWDAEGIVTHVRRPLIRLRYGVRFDGDRYILSVLILFFTRRELKKVN